MKSAHEMPVYLHRVTTFDEYEQVFGFDQSKGWPRARWVELRNEIEGVLSQGGELWEWEYRSNLGLTGVTGLAVVRDGVVLRKWQLWKA